MLLLLLFMMTVMKLQCASVNTIFLQIALYMGSLELNFNLFTQAFTGGPLGELTQWSDVMSALHILGHDLTVTSDKNDLPK